MERFWAFTPRAEAPDEVDLTVYGYITESAWWDDEAGATQFRAELDAHKTAKRINVRINSGGGEVFAGVAIYAMLVSHPAEVRVTVEGLAGSSASLIAMAGHVTMALGSMIMIHNPATFAMGEADEMRKAAEMLDQVRAGMLSIYADKTGKTPDELRDLLDAETWLTAEEAVEQGFADAIAGEVTPEARGDLVVLGGVEFPRAALPGRMRPPRGLEATLNHFIAAVSGLVRVRKIDEEQPPEAEAQEATVPTTREQLADQSPDLLAAILDEGHTAGAVAERARLQGIEDLATPGHAELAALAKYGDKPMTPEAFAVAVVTADKAAGAKYLDGARADAKPAQVPGAVAPPAADAADKAERDKLIAAGAEAGSRGRK